MKSMVNILQIWKVPELLGLGVKNVQRKKNLFTASCTHEMNTGRYCKEQTQ